MAAEVATVTEQSGEGFRLLEWALSGRTRSEPFVTPSGVPLRVFGPDQRDGLPVPSDAIAIDFSTPAAGLDNLQWFISRRIPVVMGTTGFDRNEARRIVEAGTVPAVLAPNMAVPIVMLQALLAEAAQRFPGALRGYEFELEESHQAAKKDVSGTARALVPALAGLGLPASVEGIVSRRDPVDQAERLGVPPEHLAGHAWHFYRAQSPDGNTRLEFSHRIEGRRVYAEGALTAARFLSRKMQVGIPGAGQGRVYSMVDVLAG